MIDEVLSGGNVSGVVVRVGSTVRKPWTEASPSVLAFMTAIRATGGVNVPMVLGQDAQGRQVTEFIPGQLAIDSDPLKHEELSRVGAMVRAIHDASETFTPDPGMLWSTPIPSPGDDLICHNDLAPWNLIIGERWTFIDWDGAAPSTRLWDLAYAAQAFTLSNTRQPPQEAARNLAAFVDGYAADAALRAALPAAMHRRAAAMYDLLRSSHEAGEEPWGTMYDNGHGDHWRAAAHYAGQHEETWTEALSPHPG